MASKICYGAEWNSFMHARMVAMGLEPLTIVKVHYNPPATVVIWNDKTKTVVKCGPADRYNPEVGLAMCIVKKVFACNDTTAFHKIFKQHCPKEPPTEFDASVLIKEMLPKEENTGAVKWCGSCIHKTLMASMEPCKSCLDNTARPSWKKENY